LPTRARIRLTLSGSARRVEQIPRQDYVRLEKTKRTLCHSARGGRRVLTALAGGPFAWSRKSHGRKAQGLGRAHNRGFAAPRLVRPRVPLRTLRSPSLRIGARCRREQSRARSADTIHLSGRYVRRRRAARRDRAHDPQTCRTDLGCIARRKADCENRGAEIEDRGIQDPHAEPHSFVPSFVVRRADGDRALAEGTCRPRTAAAISSRRCRR
jgi:hypothetical protein